MHFIKESDSADVDIYTQCGETRSKLFDNTTGLRVSSSSEHFYVVPLNKFILL